MAVQAYVDSLALPTTTGSKTVSPAALTFLPTGIMCNGTRSTNLGLADAAWFMGAAGSSSNELTQAFESEDGSAASDVGVVASNTGFMSGLLDNNAVDMVADFTSFNSGPFGYTYNLSDAPATAALMGYLLLGGDVTAIEPFIHNLGSGSGNKAKTGLAGTPSCVIFFTAGILTAADTLVAATSTGTAMVGWMCADGTQGYCMSRHTDALGAADTARRQRTDKCCGGFTTAAEVYEGAFVSMDANGYTINLVNAPSVANVRVYGFAIYGGLWKAGSYLSSTGTGPTSVSVSGITPQVGIFQTYGLAANTTTQTGGKRAIGAVDRGGRMWSFAVDDIDAADPTVADSYAISNRSLVSITAGTPTLNDGYVHSLDSEGFTYDHTEASGVAIQHIFLLGGNVPSPSLLWQPHHMQPHLVR
jgi:hypothetical protein